MTTMAAFLQKNLMRTENVFCRKTTKFRKWSPFINSRRYGVKHYIINQSTKKEPANLQLSMGFLCLSLQNISLFWCMLRSKSLLHDQYGHSLAQKPYPGLGSSFFDYCYHILIFLPYAQTNKELKLFFIVTYMEMNSTRSNATGGDIVTIYCSIYAVGQELIKMHFECMTNIDKLMYNNYYSGGYEIL